MREAGKSSKTDDELGKMVDFNASDDDEGDAEVSFKFINMQKKHWFENLKKWEEEAKKLAESDVKIDLDHQPKSYRDKLARNSFLEFPIFGLSAELERILYQDVHKKPLPRDLEDSEWDSMFTEILRLHASNPYILEEGHWEGENEKKPELKRWIGDYANMNYFAKYVTLLDVVVNEVHATLFPPTNKKYGRLTSPSLFLSGCDAASDPEPRCFSTVDDLTYLFYFPGDPDCEPLELGIWKDSVPTICAMQGALERSCPIPKLITSALKDQPMKMTKIQVGLANLIVMDSRLLNVRIQSKSPTLCVLWNASSKSKKIPTNDLVMDFKDNVIVVKRLYKKYFGQGQYALLFTYIM